MLVKVTSWVALLMVAFVGIDAAQSPARIELQKADEAKNEVSNIENEMNQAILQKDATVLAKIYADDLIYINGGGELLNKSRAVADYRTGNNTLVHLDHDDIQLRFYGDTIVLTGRSNSTVRYKGGVIKIPRRFTNVFVLLNRRWQIVLHQVTNVEQAPKADAQ